MIHHYDIALKPHPRGIHLITSEILSQLNLPQNGLLSIFIQHTSAGLCINENADPSVRVDLENFFDRLVQENEDYYTHTMEGSDDMPAHIKSVLSGNSLTVPIRDGRLALGTWQGIYLCEFRNQPGARKILATIYT